MMEFRTPLHIEPNRFKIGYDTPGLLVGSCFTEQIGRRMLRRKMPVLLNPSGILFNPASIAEMLDRLHAGQAIDDSALLRQGERWVSLKHHGSFSSSDPAELLCTLREAAAQGGDMLKRAGYLIITWGTAWVYEHRTTGQIAANCHKLPESEFLRHRLTADEIVRMWEGPLTTYLQDKQVIFTVSPIRHLRDGLTENQLSKSTLIVAAHTLREKYANCAYFPAYEMMMDDLRDYRFYERDMVHPSEAGVDYIWEKFCEWTLAPQATALFKRIGALQEAVSHRPLHPDSPEHKAFRQTLYDKTEQLARDYPTLDFTEELNYFK